MYFKNVLGNSVVKNSLLEEFNSDRIPHGQLFYGGDSSQQLPMALAFVTYLFCKNKVGKDSCGECFNCAQMFKLTHPDLHFFYPTIKIQKSKEKISESKSYFPEFQKQLIDNPNLSIDQWSDSLKSSKNPTIRTADLNELCKISNLRSYQGGYKVFIIWGAETIVQKSSSILLKTIEEPAPKTIFIFITNNKHNLLSTIQSRLQEKKFSKIEHHILRKNFETIFPDLDGSRIEHYIISNNNNYTDILTALKNSSDKNAIINDFVEWIRLCFLSTTKTAKHREQSVIVKIVNWSNNIGKLDKSYQSKFIRIATAVFRSAFLLNYNRPIGSDIAIDHADFGIASFSKYVQNHNIFEIFTLLSDAHYYLLQYGNSRIIFLDLSFALGKLLHKTNKIEFGNEK
tara:strand:+ start:190 stop:1386 length:1197 start_codon:yes stop_codon:yes gene_type:complete